MSGHSTLFHSSAPPLTPIREVETFSKPGTADVTVGDKKKLKGILGHYAAAAKPFTECVRDQKKHGVEGDHANRRCAVIVDLIHKGDTHWRGKGKSSAVVKEAAQILAEAIDLVQLVAVAEGPGTLASVRESDVLTEDERQLLTAAKVIESAPRWMLPVAAKQPGFKPTNPEKPSNSEFNKKHPRGSGTQGGQFIRKGTTGKEVGAVQSRLGITRTNTFNGQTKRRVEKFQEKHGLQVDGVVGAQTVAAMRGKTGVEPGKLNRNDRRFLRRYSSRTV